MKEARTIQKKRKVEKREIDYAILHKEKEGRDTAKHIACFWRHPQKRGRKGDANQALLLMMMSVGRGRGAPGKK